MNPAPLPTWEQFVVPVLRVLASGPAFSRRQVFDEVASATGLTAEQKSIRLSSGQPTYENRIGWALSDLAQVGAIHRPHRGQQCITGVGRDVLERFPDGITKRDLWAIDPGRSDSTVHMPASDEAQTPTVTLDPIEQVEAGVTRINEGIATELLQRLMEREPAFFEQAVVDLVVAMGYGGADTRATRTQLSNDGGIDGVIDRDALGLDRVHIQAKRHAPHSSVGRPEIQAFVGALHGARARHGVFITTARFSRGAADYVDSISTRVVLIDGKHLTDLMIRYRVGVQVRQTHHIVEVDEDFFD